MAKRTRTSLFVAIAGAAIAALLVGPISPADAIGSVVGEAGNGYHCATQYGPYTLVQDSSDAPTSYVMPSAGTLTDWTVQGAAANAGTFRLAVWRGTAPATYTLVYKSDAQAVPGDGMNHTFALAPPVAVAAGDHLGLIGVMETNGDPDCTRFTSGTADNAGVNFGAEPNAGDSVSFTDFGTYVSQPGKVRVNVEATFVAGGNTYSIADTSVSEGNGGYNTPHKATFTITRTGDLSAATTIHFRTESGTSDPRAIKDTDFKSRDTKVAFAIGQAQATVDVTINGDTIPEANERFRGIIDTPPVGTTISRNVALGTIIDDDGMVVVN